MAMLGDDGGGYELALKLESHGVWRAWLGDSLYSNLVHFLSSPSSWDAFMSADFGSSSAGAGGTITDYSRIRSQLKLQLRVRALLFDKASISLYGLTSNTVSSNSISKLNPNYLQLHGDDVYFTLDSRVSSMVQSRSSFSESDALHGKFKFDEFPETWFAKFFKNSHKTYRLSSGDQETTEKRTSEQMSKYLQVAENHKRKRAAFGEDKVFGTNTLSAPFLNDNHSYDDEDTVFFPETMFSMNSLPDNAVPHRSRLQYNPRMVEFNGVLDNLPKVVSKNPITMIERLISQEQASLLSKKVIARYLYKLGFEGSSELPLQVLAQLLSTHICKLGRTLRLLTDSYRRQCSSMEILKMFLHTTGYSNLEAFSELVKMTKGTMQMQHTQQNTQLHLQRIPRQMLPQIQQNPRQMLPQIQQNPRQMLPQIQQIPSQMLPQSQQIPSQMLPQFQQMLFNTKNLTMQQKKEVWERVQRQQSAPQPGMIMSNKDRLLVQAVQNSNNLRQQQQAAMSIHAQTSNQLRQQQEAAIFLQAQNSPKFRAMSSIRIPESPSSTMGSARAPPVKVENPPDFPVDRNFNATIYPNMQQFRQQQEAAMSLQAQNSNNFRVMSSIRIPQSPSLSMGLVRAPPVKVESFQDLISPGLWKPCPSEGGKYTFTGGINQPEEEKK